MLENVLGLECIGQEEGFLRFQSEASIGNTIDIKLTPSVRGLMGAGTVHHIAWRASDEEDHKRWRELVQVKVFIQQKFSIETTSKHFIFMKKAEFFSKSQLIRQVLQWTNLSDELGKKLMLPSWFESKREELEKTLPPS